MTAMLVYTLIPVSAVILGSLAAVWHRPGPAFVSAMQHLAAGVVFAAAAAEILPQIMHEASPLATLVGGALGVAAMLSLKAIEKRYEGPLAMLAAVAIDVLIDGLVLGLAFLAGATAGLLLTIALTLEVLFLGLTVTTELGETLRSRFKVVLVTSALALLLPLGALLATPVASFSPVVIGGFLSFGLMALLYLVTEELLVEAHEKPDSPLITAMFFVGFLALLLMEEVLR
jgi:ZIP family zinc transporter